MFGDDADRLLLYFTRCLHFQDLAVQQPTPGSWFEQAWPPSDSKQSVVACGGGGAIIVKCTLRVLSRLSRAVRVSRADSCSRQAGRPMVGARRVARAGSAGDAAAADCTRVSQRATTPSSSPSTCLTQTLIGNTQC